MEFNAKNFRELLSTDIWLMENLLKLPEDSTIKRKVAKDGNVNIHLYDKLFKSNERKAVIDYRDNLIPLIFIVSQKVYSELFRLFLNANTLVAGNRQVDIENKVEKNLESIKDYTFFLDKESFYDWWDGKYNFTQLRKARNQVVHNNYDFDGNNFKVCGDPSREVLLEWTSKEVIEFNEKILQLIKAI